MPVFLAPWFLIAAMAAAIPVALHLLHRRRPKPVPFGTVRFIRAAIARTRRSRHLTQVLILSLRVLIILLLALAFAQPTVRSGTWLAPGPRTVIIVLDGSASMRCRDGADTCFAHARAWATSLVRSLAKGDRVAVLVAGTPEPRLVFPPLSDQRGVVAALETAAPGFGSTDFAEVFGDVLARLPASAEARGVEWHVFSDFQRSGWDPAAIEGLSTKLAERGMVLFLNRVAPAAPVNAGFERVRFNPPAVLEDGEFQVRATVRAADGFSGPQTVRLTVDGHERAQETMRLQAGESRTVVLRAVAGGTGGLDVTGELSLDNDAFAPDDTFFFSLPRLTGIAVLLVDGGAATGRETFFLEHALQPRGRARTMFHPQTVGWPEFMAADLAAYDTVFLCNPPRIDAALTDKIEPFVRRGGILVLLPGANAALAEGASRLPGFSGTRLRLDALVQEEALGILASDRAAAIEKRLLGLMPAPSALVIRRRLLIDTLPAQALTVFQYRDGHPFIVEWPHGKGSLWLTSVGGNRDWSEWPMTPFFVVALQELVTSAAERRLTPLALTVGDVLRLTEDDVRGVAAVRVRAPSGRERLARPDGARPDGALVVDGFDEPGQYRIEGLERTRHVAVNVAAAEGDLRYVPREELLLPLRGAEAHVTETWHELQTAMLALRQGRPLWPLLLCLAFALAIAEELFANLRSRPAKLPQALRDVVGRGAPAS